MLRPPEYPEEINYKDIATILAGLKNKITENEPIALSIAKVTRVFMCPNNEHITEIKMHTGSIIGLIVMDIISENIESLEITKENKEGAIEKIARAAQEYANPDKELLKKVAILSDYNTIRYFGQDEQTIQ